MQHSNYIDYEQMSSEIINSKYNNIGLSKRQKKFFTKRRIIFIIISLSIIILILYLIFRPSKKKSPEKTNPTENNNLGDLGKEIEALSKKEEELKNENSKLASQKDSLQKENEDLEKQIKELNEKNKQNDNDKNKVEKEIEEKKEKVKEYEKKLEEIKEKIKNLNKKGKDLKDKQEENDKEIKSLQSQIEELEKELNIEKEEEKKDNNKEENKDKETDDIKSDEPPIINPELAARIDSKIIKEYKHLEILDKWFGRQLKYKLLFRASEENYSASGFHTKVDKYKNTIIFIKDINNFIYGGFTTKTWDGNKLYKSDKNSILFNLDKEKYYEVSNVDHAIFCDREKLAIFGDGDLILGPKSIESAFPKSFGNKDIKENELTMGYNKLSPVELEVFQLS